MSRKYINEFIKLKCAPDLLALKVFPNAKEITESMGAYRAVMKWIKGTALSTDDPYVHVYCIGDGVSPRTGALFAHMTRWNVTSIDPALREKYQNIPVKRLQVIRKPIAEVRVVYREEKDVAIIVLVHAHVSMNEVLKAIQYPTRHVVAIPCCKPQDIKNRVYLGYQDHHIWSPKNTVKVWINV